MVTVEELKRQLDSTAWLGVGVVGAALFLLGVYRPALASLPGAVYVEVLLAVGGGILLVLGLSFWWDQREDERLHPKVRPLSGRAAEVAIAPSFEVYHPPPEEPSDRRGRRR